MAIGDWDRFFVNTVPTQFQHIAFNVGVAGGGVQQTRLEYRGQNPSSGGAPSTWGYVYNGPDIPLRDGSISLAVRTANGLAATQQLFIGPIARLQTPVPTVTGQLDMYAAGLWFDVTELNNREIRVHRYINGVRTQLGTSFFPPLVNNSFIQFEMQYVNVASTVEIYRRWNTGAALEPPGGPNWTAFTLHATDASPGVLINGGYWGFGGINTSGWSGGSNNFVYFDEVRIIKEIA